MKKNWRKKLITTVLFLNLTFLSACGSPNPAGGSANAIPGGGATGNPTSPGTGVTNLSAGFIPAGTPAQGSAAGTSNPAAGASGSATSGTSDSTVSGISGASGGTAAGTSSAAAAATGFGLELFLDDYTPGENTLISPVSVLFALGMTANGAKGNTLTQFEDVFGMSIEELNAYLCAYRQSLPNEESCKVTAANSIWFRDKPSLTVSQSFLQQNANYYAADIYKAPFDESTKTAINRWVKDNTEAMIEEIIDSIPQDIVMYLVNAMAFDAKWMNPYEEYQIREGIFTQQDGTTQNVDFMHCEENRYLEDENAAGFLKYYAGGKYAFAALLPKEGIPLEEYIASLSGEKLNALLNHPTVVPVRTSTPKFEAEYSTELGNVLCAMGLFDAFDFEKADFSDLAVSDDGNISISKVLHKTYICVDENGTKAAAATAIAMTENAVAFEPDYKEVYLDRPFLYFLIDCEEGLPLFMGTVYSIDN